MNQARHGIEDLLTLMVVLRDPEDGCPWDIRQDWDSIVPHTLEEAYEVADVIERRAYDELPGELGDLLFQVIYYSQFAAEEGRFDFHDVVHTLTAKMLRRHPHVFPEGTLGSRRPPGVGAEQVQARQVNSHWEALKAEERAERASDQATVSVLDDVPRSLPALSRAAKLSKRAARVGFDWPDARGVIAKIREELEEVEQALAEEDTAHAIEEVGDLLFAVTNLARSLKADPEQCLRHTNAKFERRFRFVETALGERGVTTRDVDLATMERYWQQAKEHDIPLPEPPSGGRRP
ncbi:nucleoside triphosphate pyrophosphohydrolase [Billgrantia endophytica]|uniref:Nucleoside triphosphate pyrophosphohydrolase n=1 Tax=Billgrantia endophytica TaxID=2033802 RepID=A0A2N7TZ59_9GAMM|nr:nucleoside triphosphate pyrophosphohydrolase [Halomonas endophytica]PMR73459.1 nucleoside triphosphate pyrophosphohydrolase [Halomonas endophytica]